MKPRFSSGLLDRAVQKRDAWLFVCALEGEETGEEFIYFQALERNRLVDCTRVKIHLLPGAGDSSPEHVFERIAAFHEEYVPRTDRDQCWLVLDRDRWTTDSLATVAKKAHHQGYLLAVSNPCFELWLLLHETGDLGFLEDVHPAKRSQATKRKIGELRAAISDRLPITLEGIHMARKLARVLDIRPRERWPNKTGTRVYRLIDALVSAGVLASS